VYYDDDDDDDDNMTECIEEDFLDGVELFFLSP